MPERTVKHVLFYSPLGAGRPGNVMLCECVDGYLRLFRDDQVLPDRKWSAGEVTEAVIAYQELKAQLRREPEGGSPAGFPVR